MSWALVIGWYVAGLAFGVLALWLAERRGVLSSGAAVFALLTFIFLWPVLTPIALVTHFMWLLEVRSSDRETRA